MDNQVIVISPAQLKTMIEEAVKRVVPLLADFRRKNEYVESDSINIDKAILFLSDQGLSLKKQSIYDLTSKNLIPYKKNGRRIIFSRKDLLSWVNSRMVDPNDSIRNASNHIRESVNKRRNKV